MEKVMKKEGGNMEDQAAGVIGGQGGNKMRKTEREAEEKERKRD